MSIFSHEVVYTNQDRLNNAQNVLEIKGCVQTVVEKQEESDKKVDNVITDVTGVKATVQTIVEKQEATDKKVDNVITDVSAVQEKLFI